MALSNHIVPVIVVFTKYDLLVSSKELEILESLGSNVDSDTLKTESEKQADEAFLKQINDLETLTKRSHRYVRVSCKLTTHHRLYRITSQCLISTGHDEDSIQKLADETHKNLAEAVWLPYAIAQRASADLKIVASIEWVI